MENNRESQMLQVQTYEQKGHEKSLFSLLTFKGVFERHCQLYQQYFCEVPQKSSAVFCEVSLWRHTSINYEKIASDLHLSSHKASVTQYMQK